MQNLKKDNFAPLGNRNSLYGTVRKIATGDDNDCNE